MTGRYFAEVLTQDNDVYAPGRQELDITNRDRVIKSIRDFKPEVVIHCAAFTDVDGCEVDKEKSYRVNAFGTQYLCDGCSDIDCVMVYLSTDFVFDGRKVSPYLEIDIPNPLSVYAQTKLLGEYYVSHIPRRFVIVRPSRIFGPGGRNFASRLPELMRQKNSRLTLTDDIVNSPTYVVDLVDAVRFLLKQGFYGIVNVCNRGECSWYGYGLKVKEVLKLKDVELIPVRFTNFQEKKAERPHYSVLSTQLLESLGFKVPEWQDSLRTWLSSSEKKR